MKGTHLAGKFFDSNGYRIRMLTTLDGEVTSAILDQVTEEESENFVVVLGDSEVFPERRRVCQQGKVDRVNRLRLT